MKINYQIRVALFAGLLLACGFSYCDARFKCVQTVEEGENGEKRVRQLATCSWDDFSSAKAKNDAVAFCEKEALAKAVGGKVKSGVEINNFLLRKQYITMQSEGYVLYSSPVEDPYFNTGKKLVSVCVDVTIRSLEYDPIAEFSLHPPSVVVTVVPEDIPEEQRITFMSGLERKLDERYKKSITRSAKYGAVTYYKSYHTAVDDNQDADFLIILRGLNYSRRKGNLSNMGLSVKQFLCETPGLGPAREGPIVLPGENAKMDIRDEDTLQKKVMGNIQDWSLSKIDYVFASVMQRANKIVTFTRKLDYGQFMDFTGILERVTAKNAGKISGEPAIIPKKNKNYFNVQWQGTTDELAKAISAESGRKFEVEDTDFWKVVVRPVLAARGKTARRSP